MKTFDDNIISWIKGIPYELAFWNNVWKRSEGMKGRAMCGESIRLEGFDVETFLASQSNPVVLDVGCGMSFSTGDRARTAKGYEPIEVHYIDPLARFYNGIKNRSRKNLPDIEFGMMECLSGTCTSRDVALIIIKNALDHSFNPVKGILESLEVLRIGGVLYLKHYLNEAETEHYNGFHKYNICSNEKGELLIWNKNSQIVLDELIRDFAEIGTTVSADGHIISIIRKTKDISAGLIDHRKDKGELAVAVLEQTIRSFSLSFVLLMKIEYLYFNVMQFFAQSLSKRNRQKLRRFFYEERSRSNK